MKTTYIKLIEFTNVADAYVRTHLEESKLTWGLNRVIKRARKILDDYQFQVEEINITHCAVDGSEVILRDERGQFKFTKEEILKRNRKIRDLQRTTVEIEPYIVAEVPEGLSIDQKEAFEEFVFEATESKLEVVA
jgi:hypothetical protein